MKPDWHDEAIALLAPYRRHDGGYDGGVEVIVGRYAAQADSARSELAVLRAERDALRRVADAARAMADAVPATREGWLAEEALYAALDILRTMEEPGDE